MPSLRRPSPSSKATGRFNAGGLQGAPLEAQVTSLPNNRVRGANGPERRGGANFIEGGGRPEGATPVSFTVVGERGCKRKVSFRGSTLLAIGCPLRRYRNRPIYRQKHTLEASVNRRHGLSL